MAQWEKQIHLPNVVDARFDPRVGKTPHATEQPSPCSTATEPLLQSPLVPACQSLQSCLTLCHPTDCSPPGFSVHGILQTRTLEWAAFPISTRAHELQLETSCTAAAEACAPDGPGSNKRSRRSEKPGNCRKEPRSLQLQKSPHSNKMAKNKHKISEITYIKRTVQNYMNGI